MAAIETDDARVRHVRPMFGTADLVWEQVQETAVRAYRKRVFDNALVQWQRGLAIAGSKFERFDPRRGTSLVNVAFALRRRGDIAPAQRHFLEAEEVFKEDWRWVGQMRPPGGSDEAYSPTELWCFRKLAHDLHQSAQRIRALDDLPVGRLERWWSERPASRSDLRKLLGASLLLVSGSDAD